jgi:hypothetical protein
MRMRNVYFAGTALVTIGAVIEGGLVPALFVSGGALLFYSFCLALAQAERSL